jgi:vacuolar-type H+-ATPase subunit I/STV1
MSRLKKIGLILILSGVVMFLFGGYIMTYQGKSLSEAASTFGFLSFILWLPTIITGIILMSQKSSSTKK